MVLHSCSSCASYKAGSCPYSAPDECATLSAEMRGVTKSRPHGELLVGDQIELHESDATRRLVELARAMEGATMRREHPIAYAIEVLKAAGFSMRQIEKVTRSGLSKDTIHRGLAPFRGDPDPKEQPPASAP